ncbi:MAG: HAD-IIIC family phosphatase [Kineosporiaceae bacterium]
MTSVTATETDPGERRGTIKCVVWDLDDTVWDGVLLESPDVILRPSVVNHLRELDSVGVLHSIASRNDHDTAMAKLEELGVAEYFLCPQINWNSKSSSMSAIAEQLNLGLDAFAFVDDQPFERAEVGHALPAVTLVDADDIDSVLRGPAFRPRFVTDESARRRAIYRGQLDRNRLEREFVGSSEEFLAGLAMRFRIEAARQEDLQRAEELTVRTNQLNATGQTYSYRELDELRRSADHLLLVASLEDRFGDYGKIGLALVDRNDPNTWVLKLMLMSCRVMSRGVGTILLHHVMRLARDAGAGLRADFVETGRNRMMQITYAFAGFTEHSRDGDRVVFLAGADAVPEPPPYVRVETPQEIS